MSSRTLYNPLDGFASYSTHYILLAARSTERIKVFADPQQNQSTLDAIDKTEFLGDNVQHPLVGNDVFLVLDTRRFSHFGVQDLRYEVAVNGLIAGAASTNFISELELSIVDNVGISFFNYMQWLLDAKLQTNFDGIVFLLRVIFVGHREDGTSETVQTVTIPMTLFNLDLDLDYSKGIYTCQFMPCTNFSTTTHSRWLNIGNAATYFTGRGSNTLGAMVKSFENALNSESEKLYNEVSAALITRAGRAPRPGGKFGRKVLYRITLPKEWNNLTYTGKSLHSAFEKDFKKLLQDAANAKNAQKKEAEKTPARDSYFATDSGHTITQVLDEMFKGVNGIHKLANEQQLEGNDRIMNFYKHLVHVTSDDDTFIVHVDVIPYSVPDAKPSNEEIQKAVSEFQNKWYVFTEDGRRIPANFFEFDYIFTGKNIDILNLDLKFQQLHFLLVSNVAVSEGAIYNRLGQGQRIIKRSNAKQATIQKPEILSYRQYDPLLIPIMSKAQKDNFSQFVLSRDSEANTEMVRDYQAYMRNLSAFYAASPIQVNMTIRGNPDLMAKFNMPRMIDHRPGERDDEYRARLEEFLRETNEIAQGPRGLSRTTLGGSSYVTTPVFAKVNIKGPNVDFRTNSALRDSETQELIADQDFTSAVLIDNYYTVMKITNNIQGGVFTQDLELWVHNVFGYESPVAADATKKQPVKAP